MVVERITLEQCGSFRLSQAGDAPSHTFFSGFTNVHSPCEEHKSMQSQAQRLISRFRTIVLAAVTALLITSAALPMSAQNSVPASASQAARMPEFAKRLAHPATPRMPAKSPVSVPSDRGRHLPPVNGIAYDNGPVNGQVDAWTINFGFAASDTIQVNGSVKVFSSGLGWSRATPSRMSKYRLAAAATFLTTCLTEWSV